MLRQTAIPTTTELAVGRVARAERTLAARRLGAPASIANRTRNARAEGSRSIRWRPARDELWRFIEPHLAAGARAAVVGAGNGDDLPLTRLAARAGAVALFDIDAFAARRARRREPHALRRRINVFEHDITAGAADAICRAAPHGDLSPPPQTPITPLPGAPYELVVGDLFYSQLLYPALLDLDLPSRLRGSVLARLAPPLIEGVVARLHASAPAGVVAHLHDPVAWGAGCGQPFTLAQIMELARRDRHLAIELAGQGIGPRESDPRRALQAMPVTILATGLWQWPFTATVDYLVTATLAASTPPGRAG